MHMQRRLAWVLTVLVALMVTLMPLSLAHAGEGTVAGDATGDGVVDVGDVIKEERCIIGWDECAPGADADANGAVDMGDVLRTLYIILDGSWAP